MVTARPASMDTTPLVADQPGSGTQSTDGSLEPVPIRQPWR